MIGIQNCYYPGLKSCSTETSWLTKAFIMRVPFATENTHSINKWYESLWILQRKIKSHIIVKQIRIIEFCVDHWIVLCNMMKSRSRTFHGLSAVPHLQYSSVNCLLLFLYLQVLTFCNVVLHVSLPITDWQDKTTQFDCFKKKRHVEVWCERQKSRKSLSCYSQL